MKWQAGTLDHLLTACQACGFIQVWMDTEQEVRSLQYALYRFAERKKQKLVIRRKHANNRWGMEVYPLPII